MGAKLRVKRKPGNEHRTRETSAETLAYTLVQPNRNDQLERGTTMNPKPTLYAIGACALAVSMVAATPGPSWFEARTTGTKTLTLRGEAEFGVVTQHGEAGAFVMTLGASSPTGAVLFTSGDGARLEAGVYDLALDSPIQALIVTGSPERPTGAFYARGGSLTITRSGTDFMAGHFQIDAVGYEAAEPEDEDRPLAVRGVFTAAPSR
jgi:hypothetical protein